MNKKVPLFISPLADPQAVAVDTLQADWNRWKTAYLFPPPNLLPKLMDKISTFKGRLILVTPDWPLRPWFVRLLAWQKDSMKLESPILSQLWNFKRVTCTDQVFLNLRAWLLCPDTPICPKEMMP